MYSESDRFGLLPLGQNGLGFSVGQEDRLWNQDNYDRPLSVDHGVSALAVNDENVLDPRYEVVPQYNPPVSSSPAGHSRCHSSSSVSTASCAPSVYEFSSSNNYNMPLAALSPLASPGKRIQSASPAIGNRGRSVSAPRKTMRTAPYSVDSRRTHGWPNGVLSQGSARQRSSSLHGPSERSGSSMRSIVSGDMPTGSPAFNNHRRFHSFQDHTQPYLSSQLSAVDPTCDLFPPLPAEFESFKSGPELASQGVFRMLQSNVHDTSDHHFHYAALSDPPDLFAPLHEEQCAPPPEDMNPSDPDMVPHEQELRFDGDLYAPKWVRGQGNKREGWCGICKPGRWLVLKNSAFWYDKSFSHGVSATTGHQFQGPLETRRSDGNPESWEGLCEGCSDWVALISSKRRGTTWFRHAYKCHQHQKDKEPKRRRECSTGRAATADPEIASIQQPLSSRALRTPPQAFTSPIPHTLMKSITPPNSI
ncbi:MAG: hypothetical protein M4579_001965 [Chaenotheca gracillima]|nr:MAG: hypothetical protein M4579_001965 [Chaenotheca gracillima]